MTKKIDIVKIATQIERGRKIIGITTDLWNEMVKAEDRRGHVVIGFLSKDMLEISTSVSSGSVYNVNREFFAKLIFGILLKE